MAAKPVVRIAFCYEWGYEEQAVRAAAELLAAIPQRLAEVALVPATGGRFAVELGKEQIFDKNRAGRFPAPGEILDLVKAKL